MRELKRLTAASQMAIAASAPASIERALVNVEAKSQRVHERAERMRRFGDRRSAVEKADRETHRHTFLREGNSAFLKTCDSGSDVAVDYLRKDAEVLPRHLTLLDFVAAEQQDAVRSDFAWNVIDTAMRMKN